jgi:hypothetical protein
MIELKLNKAKINRLKILSNAIPFQNSNIR